MRIAVIDIGSNSIRMQLAEVKDGIYDIIEEYKEILRLGDDVFQKGIISKEKLNSLTSLLKQIKEICYARSAETIRCVATASLREALNREEVILHIKKETGIEIEVIDGKKEAYLGFLGASANFELKDTRVLITDIGGGSAEFVVADNETIEFIESTPYGCNKLFVEHFKHDPPLEKKIRTFKKLMEKRLKSMPIDRRIEHLICLGGTINNIAYIRHPGTYSRIKYVERKFLKGFLRQISKMTIKERKKIRNLEAKRADIVLPAALLLDLVLELTGKDGFHAIAGGLRTGLTIETINKMGVTLSFQKRQHSLRLERIMEVGRKFKFERQHAQQVRKLALSIFDQLKEKFPFNPRDRMILEAAALLHDIGNYISYSHHHKHSYYLIKHSELIGYSVEEIELISLVARYHRKSLPKETHEGYATLDEENRKRVEMLSSILRIADALNRRHESKVESISCHIHTDMVIFDPKGIDDYTAEAGSFNKKNNLFEKAFEKKVVLKW